MRRRRIVDLGARLGVVPPAQRPGEQEARARHPSAQARPLPAVPRAVPAGVLSGWLTGVIERAGSPRGASPDRLAAQMAAAAAVGLVASLLLRWHGGALADLAAGPTLLLVLASATAAAAIPLVPLLRRARIRSEQVAADLPDALDLLALATSAGLGLDAAVARVSRACPGPLGQELTRWQHEVALGVPRAAALREVSRRSGVPELLALAAAVGQAESAGSPLADAVAAQARVQRLHRALMAEERAQRLPVQLVFPLVLCILPALLVVIIGPAAVSLGSSGALP